MSVRRALLNHETPKPNTETPKPNTETAIFSYYVFFKVPNQLFLCTRVFYAKVLVTAFCNFKKSLGTNDSGTENLEVFLPAQKHTVIRSESPVSDIFLQVLFQL